MRVAVLSKLDGTPRLDERSVPAPGAGQSLLEVVAVPLNPIDIAVASGRHYAGHPSLPYIPGVEAIVRVIDSRAHPVGTLAWVGLTGMGVTSDGALAERLVANDDALVPIPSDADPALAAALGIAGMAGWLPVAWRAPVQRGETVLVLGATGTVGQVALQAARILGAGRIVAAGRAADRLRATRDLGADATVSLGEADVPAALRAACGPDGPSLIIDPVWGEPLQAALEIAAPGARVVNLGQSAGSTATIPSAAVRGKQLELLGFSDFAVPRDVWRRQYTALVDHAGAGRIHVALGRFPFTKVAAAWDRQRNGPGVKLVLIP